MCKPISIEDVRVKLQRFPYRNGRECRSMPRAVQFAWMFRRLADWIDRNNSYTIDIFMAKEHRSLVRRDILDDALGHGLAAIGTYIVDAVRDDLTGEDE